MSRGVSIHIDKAALQHNVNRARHYGLNTSMIAMVKANGYGHGLVDVARVLHDVDALGVACIEEAIILRKHGVTTPLVLIEGFFDDDELFFIINNQCTVVLHTLWQVTRLLAYCKKYSVPPFFIWLKYDSGMHRLGMDGDELQQGYNDCLNNGWCSNQLGLMTHFACANDLNSPMTHQQYSNFLQVTKEWPGPRSACNSAGILEHGIAHSDWIRPGLMLYGVSPVQGRMASYYDLKPVMTVTARLFACRTIKKGESVGYGASWRSNKERRIGVVAFGYGDGYPYHAPSGTPVLLNGVEVPLVGAVSMDMITVDLTSCPKAKVGDPVVLWGNGLPVEQVAQWANTIPYELLCHVRSRTR